MPTYREEWTDEARQRSIEVRQAEAKGKVQPTETNQHASGPTQLPSHDDVADVVGDIYTEGRDMLEGVAASGVKEGGQEHAQFFRDLNSKTKPISGTSYEEIKGHVEGLKKTHSTEAMAGLAKELGISVNKTMAGSKSKLAKEIHLLHTERLESWQRTRF